MKNILIVAYYYPPMGGSGVQRIAKFAKYLNKFGYNINVLTVKENSNMLLDKSLYSDIESNIKVYRTEYSDTSFLSKILNKVVSKNKKSNESIENSTVKERTSKIEGFKSKIKRTLRNIGKKIFFQIFYLTNIPDDKKLWIKTAVNEGEKIINSEKIDLIISTSAPYSTHEIAYILASKYNLKWIADFRDPWVSNSFANYNWFLKLIYKKYEKKYIEKADKVISVSQPIIDDFIARYSYENKEKFKVIPNGYDESDFEGFSLEKEVQNEKYTILYNGTLYGIESPESFLSALENLIEKGKINKDKILLRFIGRIGHDQRIMIDNFSLKYPDLIQIKGFMPHEENIKELFKADSLLLIINEGKGTEGIYTGKIFEYIRTGIRVLGILPKGVARELLVKTNTGYLAHSNNLEENEQMILKGYNDFIENKKNESINWETIKNYSRENLTSMLKNIIEEI